MKNKLNETLEKLQVNYDMMSGLYPQREKGKELHYKVTEQLKQAQLKQDRQVSQLTPDQVKELGSNETIRKTKLKVEFEEENKDLIESEKTLAGKINEIDYELNTLRREREFLATSKDIIICLVNNSEIEEPKPKRQKKVEKALEEVKEMAKAGGMEEEQVEQLIEDHAETVDITRPDPEVGSIDITKPVEVDPYKDFAEHETGVAPTIQYMCSFCESLHPKSEMKQTAKMENICPDCFNAGKDLKQKEDESANLFNSFEKKSPEIQPKSERLEAVKQKRQGMISVDQYLKENNLSPESVKTGMEITFSTAKELADDKLTPDWLKSSIWQQICGHVDKSGIKDIPGFMKFFKLENSEAQRIIRLIENKAELDYFIKEYLNIERVATAPIEALKKSEIDPNIRKYADKVHF